MGGEDSGRLRLFLAAMPLLAGVYEAYEAASPGFEPSTFGLELARRLPLALILAGYRLLRVPNANFWRRGYSK